MAGEEEFTQIQSETGGDLLTAIILGSLVVLVILVIKIKVKEKWWDE